MIELRGQPVAKALNEACKADIAALTVRSIIPRLAIVRIGAREDDLAYERGIIKRFDSAGAGVRTMALGEDVSQEELERVIAELNADADIHGILLFRPLPKPLSQERIKRLIAREKDIDCMGYQNIADVFGGVQTGFASCTPRAVMALLEHYGIELAGKKVTVVGRSMVVGRPLTMLLMSRHATVTICHTRTVDLAEECRRADILIACAGKANMIGPEHVRAGQNVIDVGINMVGDRLCGDVDFEAVKDLVAAITPVPGGVGAVTTSVLLSNTVKAAFLCG